MGLSDISGEELTLKLYPDGRWASYPFFILVEVKNNGKSNGS
jgi:hypothetical protein